MRTTLYILFAAALVTVQAQKKPGVKPPPKSQSAPGVKGTAQLPGDNGKVDQTYTMGSERKLNFTLRSAEYTLGRLVVGEDAFCPTKEQKLLALKFTVQNPNKEETQIRFDTFKMMAVDSKDVNHEWISSIAKENENKQALDVQLKPGQKVEVVGGIMVPADASVPKLMVQHNTGGKVLRYDLRGIVKPLVAPFADPADKSGSTALVEIPAVKENFYPLEHFDLKYVTSSLSSDPMGANTCEEGKQFFVATVTLRNSTNIKQHYRFDTLHARFVAADGEKEESSNNLLFKTSRNEDVDSELAPGETYTCRLVMQVSKEAKAAKIVLSEGDSHLYGFEVK